jgi:hypothetical protein
MANSDLFTIEDKIRATFSEVSVGTFFSHRDIVSRVVDAYPEVSENSVLPSDRCYNITNAGLSYDYSFRVFEHAARGKYRYLGERYPYTGPVTWNGQPCGCWTNGVLKKESNWPYRK